MHIGDPQPRIGARGGAVSRVKHLALKALLVVGGVITLASAFVVSLVFVAIGMALVLVVGGYLWWQTRALRRELRARMRGQSQSLSDGDFIEGEVISPDQTRR